MLVRGEQNELERVLLGIRYLVGFAILTVARNLPVVGFLLALWVGYACDVWWLAGPAVFWFAYRIDQRLRRAEREENIRFGGQRRRP